MATLVLKFFLTLVGRHLMHVSKIYDFILKNFEKMHAFWNMKKFILKKYFPEIIYWKLYLFICQQLIKTVIIMSNQWTWCL